MMLDDEVDDVDSLISIVTDPPEAANDMMVSAFTITLHLFREADSELLSTLTELRQH